MKKYKIANTEAFVDILGDAEDYPGPFVILAAGFSPEDEEVCTATLAQDWAGHRAGDIVVHGLTANGHRFAVLSPEEAEDWRKAAYSVVSRQKGRVYELLVNMPQADGTSAQEPSGEYYLALTVTGRMGAAGGGPAGVACWSEAEGYTWSREAPGPGRFVRWN